MTIKPNCLVDAPEGVTCATCGKTLTQVGSNGECLRCLADLGFLCDPPNRNTSEPRRRLTPGPLKYDHFEVEVGSDGFPVELGAGASAITYRARDTVLNSAVALKVIDRNLAQNPTVRSRFLREARAAAQIRHPNVAHVSHYGEQQGECFYVMELAEGESLEARIRRGGPMPVLLALEVIEQTTRALAAAEAHGIVHRDIKPSNIMLGRDAAGTLVVKVIDYGLAKVLGPESDRGAEQTHTGFLGTPAFASPEQFARDGQKRIDMRADIYSLGVTFWYLLSGRVPFVGRTLEDIRARQMEPLPLDQLRRLRVPSRCFTLLKWMLAEDPADRPQSVCELLHEVHRCRIKFSTEAQSRRKRSVLVVLGIALIIAAMAVGVWSSQRPQLSLDSERSIAVLPFEDLSPNAVDSYFAIGLRDEIIDDLTRLADVKVVGLLGRRSYAAGKERNLGAMGRNLGVRYVLDGYARKSNGDVWISLRLIDLRNSHQSWSETYECPGKDVFTLETEIAHALALQLGAQLPPLGMPRCIPEEAKPRHQAIYAWTMRPR